MSVAGRDVKCLLAKTHQLGLLLSLLVKPTERVLEARSKLLQRLGVGLPSHGGLGGWSREVVVDGCGRR